MAEGNFSHSNSDGEREHPLLVNYTHVGMAEGLAHVDFEFFKPALLGLVARRVKQGEAISNQLNGPKAARVAVPLPSAVRVNQQLQQMRGSLQPPKPKQF